METSNIKKMSFFTKETINCPACGTPTHREDMLTGRGRLSAQELTIELRRRYQPIPILGRITPLIYSLTTCHECLCSLLSSDFSAKNFTKESIDKINANKKKRIDTIQAIFKTSINFREPKKLIAAAAAYYLAINTYPLLTPDFSPTIKATVVATRFYWLLEDIALDFPQSSPYFNGIRAKMIPNINRYFKAAREKVTKGGEELPSFYGPDTDRNNGFQGFIYLNNYFSFLDRPQNNPIAVEEICRRAKQELSKIFGIGKTSVDRPVPILNIVREFYDMVDEEHKSLTSIQEELS